MALPDLKKQFIERDQDYLFYKKGYYELKEEKEKNEAYLKNKLKAYEKNFTKLEKDNETIINLLNKLNETGTNNTDLNKNIIALWHDESYLNKYVLKKKKYRLLGIDFANPLSDDPHKAMIHMRQKDRYFSTGDVKKDSPKTQLKGLNRIYYEETREMLQKDLDRIRGVIPPWE